MEDPGFRWISPRQHRGDTRGSKRRYRVEICKHRATLRKGVEARGRWQLVAVERHIFGAQSVEGDEEDVRLGSLRNLSCFHRARRTAKDRSSPPQPYHANDHPSY